MDQQLRDSRAPLWRGRRRQTPFLVASAAVCALYASWAHTSTLRIIEVALACVAIVHAAVSWIVPEPPGYEAKQAALRARREAMGITKPWHHVAMYALVALAIALPLLFVATTHSRKPCGCSHTVRVTVTVPG